MTQEETIRSLRNIIEYWAYKPTEVETARMAITALRPVNQERVERVWPGCEACKDAGLATEEIQFYGPFEGPTDVSGNMHYCPNCDHPITPVAKDGQGERLETLRDEKSDL